MTTDQKDQQTRLVSKSPEDTYRIAADVLRGLKPGAVLALHGVLGAGKTCFVQGLAEALGISRAVNSPTFTLVNEYPGPVPLYHVDLYRVRGPNEALSLGLDELLYGSGITAIEWAERIAELLPPDTLHISLAPGAARDERRITIRRGSAP